MDTLRSGAEKATAGDEANAGPGGGLRIAMLSIHGLIRGSDLELGRDADTGGQTKYVVELASALGEMPDVKRVDLITRRIDDTSLSDSYAKPLERLSERANLIRIPDPYATDKDFQAR